ncbi:endosome-associated-trafficking regulator 1-like [Dendronephthya gigantea]|uniref:endosome-associated-trafficking regulator 1-like n=1 Tax=Dendronephthya gigantea TaxID=151771 RepID=UPI00106CA90C|nr:endosome-associated-trafficking regulator 1-like [Dendronephthya gigantea]
MVEKNLELTTQRAAQAEAMNLKLKEENKILKSNSVSKAVYDDLVKKHQSYISGIKEQALSVSQHLETTAKNAEESLRKLYSGADSLKLASQLLDSIGKFTNLDGEDDVK